MSTGNTVMSPKAVIIWRLSWLDHTDGSLQQVTLAVSWEIIQGC